MLARVLVAYPPDRPALWTDEALPDDVAKAWRDLLAALLALPAGVDELGEPQPRLIQIGKEAKPSWVEWHDRHARDLVDIGIDDLAAHYAKLKGACARIALLFACVDVAAGGEAVVYISADAMRRAIAVTEWFKGEARRVYGVLSESEADHDRRRLVEWIERRGGGVSVRDLTHSLHRYRNQPDEAKGALDALEQAGFGRWTHPAPGPNGGRPSALFVLNSAEPVTKNPAGDSASVGFGCGDAGDGVAATCCTTDKARMQADASAGVLAVESAPAPVALSPALAEVLEERAAIMEYDAGLPRSDAEAAAAADTLSATEGTE